MFSQKCANAVMVGYCKQNPDYVLDTRPGVGLDSGEHGACAWVFLAKIE